MQILFSFDNEDLANATRNYFSLKENRLLLPYLFLLESTKKLKQMFLISKLHSSECKKNNVSE